MCPSTAGASYVVMPQILQYSYHRYHAPGSCAGIMCRDHVPGSRAGIMCRDHVPGSCAGIMCRDHVPGSRAGISCRADSTLLAWHGHSRMHA